MAIYSTQVQFDSLFGLFTYLAFAVGIVVFTFMIYLIVRYREKASSRQPQDTPILGKQPQSRGHLRTVLLTLTLSTIILVPLIVGSFGAVDSILTPPQQVCQASAIEVPAHHFYCQFTNPNATKPYTPNNLHTFPPAHTTR